ncbi:CPBP family intramembrane glutamic endopeptidase [Chryseobacterium sp. HSC-36S06]|jgi:membrane protease YdiL (CAAX protease family)|uniref:CPBP family intramembrane glutamic endopeptidase n=1 Tax=Chryseobacterium group TaxID=2782232 RepID=UPI0020A19AF2|nr:CPBP family intramembrane glutamic endopeptidase [Chryseobacterium sp. HSC-36S06]MCP2036938.1 membrane protease YdiL (CAAX protease family) [Chryseobacterium sp. HSC-36S06]
MKENIIDFKRILIFLIIAISLSNIFRFDVFGTKEILQKLPTWMYLISVVLLEGSGVFIGALIAIYLLRKDRKTSISFYGTSNRKGLLMSAIPIVLLTIIGVKNDYEININLYGLIVVLGSLIYCIMEEFGWRGYLQEELKNLKPVKRYLIIGFIWYFWHLTFLTEATISENLFFLGMLLFGSWGIGQVAESTKSILASACFHLIIQIMMFNSLIKNGLDGTQKLIILGVSVFLWILILKKWQNKYELKSLNEEQSPNR